MVVDDLLINMPRILEYFVPGYMAIFTYRRLKNSDNDSIPEAIHIGACVVISYLLKGFLKIIWNCDFISALFSFAQSDLYLRCISLSIFGIVFAIFILKLRRIPVIRKLFNSIYNTSLSESIFELCNMEDTPDITVYGERQAISGRLLSYDLKSEDAWMVLDYCKIFEEGKEKDNWKKHNKYERYLIPLSEVKCIVVHYKEKDSIYPIDYEKARKEE